MWKMTAAVSIASFSGLMACGDQRPVHDPSVISCGYDGKPFDAQVDLTSCVGAKQRLAVSGRSPARNTEQDLVVTDMAGAQVPFTMRVKSVADGTNHHCLVEVAHAQSKTRCVFDNAYPKGVCEQGEKIGEPLCPMELEQVYVEGLDRYKGKK